MVGERGGQGRVLPHDEAVTIFEQDVSEMIKKHFQGVLDLCEAKLVYKAVKFVLTRRYNESARET